MAVHPGASVQLGQRIVHPVDGSGRGVSYARPRGGGSALGQTQEQGGHELRQDGTGAAILLRQTDSTQGMVVERRSLINNNTVYFVHCAIMVWPTIRLTDNSTTWLSNTLRYYVVSITLAHIVSQFIVPSRISIH